MRFGLLAHVFGCPDCGYRPLASDDFIVHRTGIYHVPVVWCGPVKWRWQQW